ncbi:MAG TPA: hypothetical protein VFZ89_11930 [Solirubrobacteraceae bacterium]
MSIRARLADERGFTLAEQLVAMTVAVLVLGVVLLISQLFTTNAHTSGKLTQIEDESRRVMTQLVRAVRDAPTPTGARSPIAVVRSGDLIFAGRSAAGADIWLRYCVGGTNNDTLVRGETPRLSATLTDPGTVCPTASTGGWTYGKVFTPRQSHGGLVSASLFTCDPSCTANPVRSVAVRLERRAPGNRTGVLTSAVSPRNFYVAS